MLYLKIYFYSYIHWESSAPHRNRNHTVPLTVTSRNRKRNRPSTVAATATVSEFSNLGFFLNATAIARQPRPQP